MKNRLIKFLRESNRPMTEREAISWSKAAMGVKYCPNCHIQPSDANSDKAKIIKENMKKEPESISELIPHAKDMKETSLILNKESYDFLNRVLEEISKVASENRFETTIEISEREMKYAQLIVNSFKSKGYWGFVIDNEITIGWDCL